MATLKRSMFREYDIRGRESQEELNVGSILHIVRGFARMLHEGGITECIVGHDARATSELFHARAMEALTRSGINVIDIGCVTTPMSYWAQHHFKARGLCMITASHNPAGWNGLKLGTDLSQTLGPEEIKTLYGIVEREEYVNGNGAIREEGVAKEYMSDLVNRSHMQRRLRILVNTGNGTAGIFAPELLRRAGHEVVEHLTNIDASYPNYTPNPDGLAMMQDTGKQTVDAGCDIGLAFDGDGDRLGVVDERGEVVWPDRTMILLSRLVLSRTPGAKIVFDVKVSEALPEDIAAHGGIPIMWKTGHSYIKAKMAQEKAALAGEMSGHIFFSEDYYGFDDAFFAALKLLEYLSGQSKSVSAVVGDTPYYVSTPTIQARTSDEKKYGIVDQLVASFKKDGYRVIDINGARVYMEGGWGLVRASSNTPSLVLRFEAKTQNSLENIQKVFREKLSAFPDVNQHWDTSGR
jgi:phosphomannomutase/phosphoglucomutase